MRIGVIGHMGIVGSAVRHGLERIGHTVIGCDPAAPATRIKDVIDTEVVFVCVPTPADFDGSCDTSIVEDTIDDLDELGYAGVVAIKSTITPGTSQSLWRDYERRLRIAFVPEFLRERAAFVDFYEHHDVCIIGVQGEHADQDFDVIKRAHGSLPRHVERMSATEAELAKYFSNLFNALRVVFACEFAEVAKVWGADYQTIKNALVKRSGIPDVYLDVNDRFRGFGGVCLPKDTRAFATMVDTLGLSERLKIFRVIVDENAKLEIKTPDGMRP